VPPGDREALRPGHAAIDAAAVDTKTVVFEESETAAQRPPRQLIGVESRPEDCGAEVLDGL